MRQFKCVDLVEIYVVKQCIIRWYNVSGGLTKNVAKNIDVLINYVRKHEIYDRKSDDNHPLITSIYNSCCERILYLFFFQCCNHMANDTVRDFEENVFNAFYHSF